MCRIHEAPRPQNPQTDAFVQMMVGHLNGAALMLMTSIGHRTGLFDAMEDGAWYTSQDLAQKAELSERYVREWLGAMTTGRIVEHDASAGRFRLPEAHAAALTRSASPGNFATSSQWIAVLGAVEDKVVEAFHTGRGVPYSAYGRFAQVMAEESNQTTLGGIDDQILPLVPGLVERLEAGIDVADIGCGLGRVLIHLARRFPRSRFFGLDYLESQVADARAAAAMEGLENVRFEAADAAEWKPVSAFDLIFTFDAIHDQPKPDVVLRNIARALKPGGVYLMQEIRASTGIDRNADHPMGPFVYTISCMHCMSVSLASGGMGLGAAWGRELAHEMLAEAGFRNISMSELPHDQINDYYVARR